jgi:hypothetical protein
MMNNQISKDSEVARMGARLIDSVGVNSAQSCCIMANALLLRKPENTRQVNLFIVSVVFLV